MASDERRWLSDEGAAGCRPPLPEQATAFSDILRAHADELGYTMADFEAMLHMHADELNRMYAIEKPAPRTEAALAQVRRLSGQRLNVRRWPKAAIPELPISGSHLLIEDQMREIVGARKYMPSARVKCPESFVAVTLETVTEPVTGADGDESDGEVQSLAQAR